MRLSIRRAILRISSYERALWRLPQEDAAGVNTPRGDLLCLWASQLDGKAALRVDKPIKAARSRGLSSLPKKPTVGAAE